MDYRYCRNNLFGDDIKHNEKNDDDLLASDQFLTMIISENNAFENHFILFIMILRRGK